MSKNKQDENLKEQETGEIQVEETISKAEFDAKVCECDELKDRYMRIAAEYDNFRKRTARERESLFTDATVATITEFLSVYDNLERALSNPTDDEAYRKGIEMTFEQLRETLKKLNVEEIMPEGERFDPLFHNAVMHVEDESFEESMVVEVFQKGFKLGDKVIRHAIVKVAN